MMVYSLISLYKIWSKSTLETGIEFFFFHIILNTASHFWFGGKNPGPDFGENKLPPALWNLDSIPARDYARIPGIESFQAVYNLDIFGVCESSLTKDIPNGNIFINGFSPEPFRSDKQVNAHNGGVCMYYKENLAIKQRKDLELINETIVAEITLKRNKKVLIVLCYRHPSQSTDELNEYMIPLNVIY